MEFLDRLNAAMAYIEEHLCGTIDIDALARITLCTPDGLRRLFRHVASMPLSEYIRRRRLTCAALELRTPGTKVIDIALKYGYQSTDAFCRAFKKQHGIAPAAARSSGAALTLFLPASFHIFVKGATDMEYKLVNTNAIPLQVFAEVQAASPEERFLQAEALWTSDAVCEATDKAGFGTWYGIWDGRRYVIARREEGGGTPQMTIPAGQYAVFTSAGEAYAGDIMPQMRAQARSALNLQGRRPRAGLEIEVYRLSPYCERQNRAFSLWLTLELYPPKG